jgi:DNA-directed RNA polymerase specialized sigma54-like protein
MKLLQVPTANLEERIKEELEENPALELDEEGHEDEYGDDIQDEFDNGSMMTIKTYGWQCRRIRQCRYQRICGG